MVRTVSASSKICDHSITNNERSLKLCPSHELLKMDLKGKTRMQNAVGPTERMCPDGWVPAWDPDDSIPEWWYDKSKYSQTATPLGDNLCELKVAQATTPETPQPSVAKCAGSSGSRKQQSLHADPCQTARNTMEARHSDQVSGRSGLAPIPPSSLNLASSQFLEMPTAIGRSSVDAFTSVVPQCNSNKLDTDSRRHKGTVLDPSAPINESTTAAWHDPNGISLLEGKESVRLGHATMVLCAEEHLDKGSGNAEEPSLKERASSCTHPINPIGFDRDSTLIVGSKGCHNLYSSTPSAPQNGVDSRWTDPSYSARLMLHQLLSHHEDADESIGSQHRLGISRRTASTASSGLPARPGSSASRKTNLDSSQERGKYPASEAAVALTSESNQKNSVHNPITRSKPDNKATRTNGQALGRFVSSRKRPRDLSEVSRDSDIERPMKSLRTPHSAPSSLQRNPFVPRRAELPLQYFERPSWVNLNEHRDSSLRRTANTGATRNVTISQATLVRDQVIPGQLLANPKDPLVAQYIDAWTENSFQYHRRNAIASNAKSGLCPGMHASHPNCQPQYRSQAYPLQAFESTSATEKQAVEETPGWNPIAVAGTLDFTPMSESEIFELLNGGLRAFGS